VKTCRITHLFTDVLQSVMAFNTDPHKYVPYNSHEIVTAMRLSVFIDT